MCVKYNDILIRNTKIYYNGIIMDSIIKKKTQESDFILLLSYDIVQYYVAKNVDICIVYLSVT